MLNNPRDDVRAYACYALGYSKIQRAVHLILPFLRDPSDIVRTQAFFALLNLYKTCREYDIFVDVTELERDPSEKVRSTYETVKPLFGRVKMGTCNLSTVNTLVSHAVYSIKSVNFRERCDSNLFGIEYINI